MKNEQEQEQQQQIDEEMMIKQYYKSVQEQIQQKFKTLTTNTMQEIKNKLKRHQDQVDQQENINLIEKERSKIIKSMKQHVQQCYHPHCQQVGEITMLYHLFKNSDKQDLLTLIVRRNVQGLPKIETDCYQGSKINQKMKETHRLLAGLSQ